MKAIQVLKHFRPFHHRGHGVGEVSEGLASRVEEYVLGAICFLLFLALGPFAAIPVFFATFSIPRWLEEREEEAGR